MGIRAEGYKEIYNHAQRIDIKFKEVSFGMKITEMYLEGFSIEEIHNKLEIPEAEIIKILYDNEIIIRPILPEHFNTKHFLEENIQKAIYNYVVLKQGLQTSGKPYGISQKCLETILINRGIHKRSYTEAKQITRLYTLDDNYFKTQTHNMAWLLGFLASDGNIALKENSISLQLNEKDTEVLKKIKEEVKSSRPLDYYLTNAGNPTCKFQVWSAQWKQDLKIYGIIPQKTFSLQPPLFLKKEFWIDYIRGYFDGDGTVWGNDHFEGLSFVGASKPVIEWIKNVLSNEYGISCPGGIKTAETKNQKIMYKISYYSKQAGYNLYHALYQDKDNLIFLARKEKKFYSLIENIHETSILQNKE